jgi:shikimate kinase
MTAPMLVLVGAPGAGKTTVGELVADRLGTGFRDTDGDIEAAAGMSVADIFLTAGEEEFRLLERAAVAAALAEHTGVLALGGGAVLAAQTRAALRGLPVVWLRTGLADAAKRVGLARDRPVLALNPRGELARLLEQRTPHYAAVALAAVDTDGRTPAEVADAVLAELGALTTELGALTTETGRR